MNTQKRQQSAPAQIMNFPSRDTAKNRVFEENSLSPTFPAAFPAQILSNFDKAAEKLATRSQQDKDKARSLAVKLLSKKKVAFIVFEQLQDAGVPVRPTVMAMVAVAEGVEPGALATADTIASLAGDRPDGVTAKWWSEKLPEVLDLIGITEKKSKTERRFVELQQLKNKCSVLSSCAYNATYYPGHIVCSAADKCAKAFVINSPYIEHTKSGELVVHQKPSETPEGKEAKRAADLAAYLSKQKGKEQHYLKSGDADDTGVDLGQLDSYKKPALIAGLVVAALVVAAQLQTPQKENIETHQATMPMGFAESIAADAGN